MAHGLMVSFDDKIDIYAAEYHYKTIMILSLIHEEQS